MTKFGYGVGIAIFIVALVGSLYGINKAESINIKIGLGIFALCCILGIVLLAVYFPKDEDKLDITGGPYVKTKDVKGNGVKGNDDKGVNDVKADGEKGVNDVKADDNSGSAYTQKIQFVNRASGDFFKITEIRLIDINGKITRPFSIKDVYGVLGQTFNGIDLMDGDDVLTGVAFNTNQYNKWVLAIGHNTTELSKIEISGETLSGVTVSTLDNNDNIIKSRIIDNPTKYIFDINETPEEVAIREKKEIDKGFGQVKMVSISHIDPSVHKQLGFYEIAFIGMNDKRIRNGVLDNGSKHNMVRTSSQAPYNHGSWLVNSNLTKLFDTRSGVKEPSWIHFVFHAPVAVKKIILATNAGYAAGLNEVSIKVFDTIAGKETVPKAVIELINEEFQIVDNVGANKISKAEFLRLLNS
jgi:hypothetical protein